MLGSCSKYDLPSNAFDDPGKLVYCARLPAVGMCNSVCEATVSVKLYADEKQIKTSYLTYACCSPLPSCPLLQVTVMIKCSRRLVSQAQMVITTSHLSQVMLQLVIKDLLEPKETG